MYLLFRVDKDYSFIGQFGLALIGSTDLNLYEIIGYNDKRNLIFRVTLNNLIFCNQKDNFSTFCDNDSQRWLVQFEGNDQLEFTKDLEVCGAKIITNAEENQLKTSNLESQNSKPELMPKPLVMADKPDVQSDSSGSQRKADILNRMAKMGQQILPKVASKTTTSSDSDSELKEPLTNRRNVSRKFKRNVQEKPFPKEEVLHVPNENQVLPIQSGTISNYQNTPGAVAYPSSTGLDLFSNFILLQNTELKINLAQISAKLDSIVNKEDSRNTETGDGKLKSKIKALELRSENLEEALQKSESKYILLKEKYDNLLMEKQKEGEMEMKENEIKKLQEIIAKLTSVCETNQKKLTDYQTTEANAEQCRTKIEEYEEIIETQKLKLKEFEELCKQNKDSKELQATIDKLNAKMENLKLKQKDHDEYYKHIELEKQNRGKINNNNLNLMGEMVKRYINDMYQSVLDDFDQDETFTFKEIQGIVAKNLKDTTFKIIKECKDIFSESSNLLSD